MKKIFLLASMLSLLISCKNTAETKDAEPVRTEQTSATNNEQRADSFVASIETAYHKEAFLKHEAVQFDLAITFGGTQILKGKATFSTNSSNGKLELDNGDVIIFTNASVYHSPSITNTDRVRFNAYTWNYFFLFPYKMSDRGTVWSDYTSSELNGNMYDVRQLNFESNVGDAPDDWYVVYADPETHRINTAAYIVTLGKTTEAAEADPHAIRYDDFKMVDGIPMAHIWTFWEWTKAEGLTKQIGDAALSNITFIEEATHFNVPTDYLKI